MKILEPFAWILKTFSWTDGLDILVMTGVVYLGMKMIYEIRAERLFTGILILALGYWGSVSFNLVTVSSMLRQFFAIGVMVIVIVFQPELRRVLERFGRTKLSKVFLGFQSNEANVERSIETIEVLGCVCDIMARECTGALIVIKLMNPLEDVVRTGVVLDARITQELLLNIFFVNTPLHDGAVIISDDRVHAAGCILPLTQRIDIDQKYGTRHRAALGISEDSDALVLIVSEERGVISVAQKGRLEEMSGREQLCDYLRQKLILNNGKKQSLKDKFFGKVKATEAPAPNGQEVQIEGEGS
ncbi:MAG: diadenylate cyclase CdaA [Oscillospiraceae bacterium]|jgi:diadenylate cyclase|nr:diadenylate cyclase CdaA [Oscillospiraceae bacterium]